MRAGTLSGRCRRENISSTTLRPAWMFSGSLPKETFTSRPSRCARAKRCSISPANWQPGNSCPRAIFFMNQGGVACGIKKIARGHEFPGCQFAGDIEHRFALAHREGLLVNVSFGKFPENLHAGRSVVEKIFSGLQCTPWIPAGVNLERRRASDHSIFL